jgi:hypothetical protein
MITLPTDPYFQQIARFYFEREVTETGRYPRLNTEFYRRIAVYLKDEYHATTQYNQFGYSQYYQFESEKAKTLFLIRWT